MKGEIKMESFITWYIGINFMEKLLLIAGIVICYHSIKFVGTKLIQKSSKQEKIFKTFFLTKIIIEIILCAIGILASIFAYQVICDIWLSLCIAIILPVLIILNHLVTKKEQKVSMYN